MVEVLRDKEFLVKEYLETRGLYSHHINSFNTFIDSELKKIVQQNHAVRSDADPNFYLHFKNVTVGHPQVCCGLTMVNFMRCIMAIYLNDKINYTIFKNNNLRYL